MAGSINLGTQGDPATGVASFSLNYDDQLRATSLNGTNNAPVAVTFKIIGWDPATGVADTTGNRTYALLIPAGQAAAVTIPVGNANKSIQLSVNAKGKTIGFDSQQG